MLADPCMATHEEITKGQVRMLAPSNLVVVREYVPT
jgi:hypothetical protein